METDFLNRLANYLKVGKMSARQIAIKVGIPEKTVQNYAAGRSYPSRKKAQILADGLGIHLKILHTLLRGESVETQTSVLPNTLRVAEPEDDALSRDIAKMKLLMTELPDDVRGALMRIALDLREIRGQGKPLGRKKEG